MSEISSIYFGKKAVQSIETKNGVLYGGGDPFEYEAVDGGYAVTGFKKSLLKKGTYPRDFSIPEEHNDSPVVEIGESAFQNCSINTVNIPKSVKRLKREAFAWCNATINLDEECEFEFIGNSCLSGCYGVSILTVNGIIEGSLGNFYDLTRVDGDYSFQGYLNLNNDSKLTSINLESVTAISSNGMQNVGLQEVNIPNCTNIGYYAFRNNTAVKTLYLSTSAIYFGSYCFSGTAIEEVHCKASDVAWISKSSFKRVYLIGNETEVTSSTFYNCRNLESLVINNGCLTLGSCMCQGCSALTHVVIPNSVTTIGVSAFYNCSRLIDIAIPNSVATIEEQAFEGCSSLTNIIIPDGITSIKQEAFRGCSSLTNITLPNSLTSIGEMVLSGCSSLISISIPFIGQSKVVPEDQPKYPFGYIFGRSSYSGGVSTQQFYYNPGRGTDQITYYLPSTLKTITLTNGNYLPLGAFSCCRNITSINLPNTLTGIIEKYSFYNCSNLISITIPEGVTTLKESSFSSCNSLTTVIIPNSIEEVDGSAFSNDVSLQYNVYDNANYLGNKNNRFLVLISVAEKESVTSCSVSDSCRIVVSGAFSSCSVLETITISNSVTKIGERAFCNSLTTIVVGENNTVYDSREQCNAVIETASNKLIVGCSNTIIPNTVTSIGDYAFYYLSSLTAITIPDSVTSIGERAFYESGLTTITIPDSVTSIGESAFKYCMKLTSATLSNSITKIEYELFGYCYLLQSIVIPSSVTEIGNYAFYWCTHLTNVVIPNSVTSIGYEAFRVCSSWVNLTLPESITSIGENAFLGCGFTTVTIPGTIINLGARAFASCTRLVTVTILNGLSTITTGLFDGCTSLKTVTIPNSVTSIEAAAFEECGLTEISLPEGLLTLGNLAFYYCSRLGAITIPDSVTEIGANIFLRCSSLTTIVVGENNTVYDSREQCNAIIETASNKLITGCPNTIIPNTVTSIGDYAFNQFTSLTTITIPESVTSIGTYAFSTCGLTTITIPDSVISIGESAFHSNSSLETVVLSNSLTGISKYCFMSCSNLTDVMIYESVTKIQERAFYGCSALSVINYNGTKAQFQTISLGKEWRTNSSINTVHCSDGDITYN